jgi:hypothetical protein
MSGEIQSGDELMKCLKYILVYVVLGLMIMSMIGVISAKEQITENGENVITDNEVVAIASYTPPANFPQKPDEPRVTTTLPKGKLGPDVDTKAAKLKPGEKMRVAIWVKTNEFAPVDPESLSTDADGKKLIAQRSAVIAEKQKSVKNLLKNDSIEIVYASTLAPVIFAKMGRDEIKDIAALEDVVAIDSGKQYGYHLNNAAPSVLAWRPLANVRGPFPRVAIVEPDGVASGNPYVHLISYCHPEFPNVGEHATACAGFVASTDTTYKGIDSKTEGILSGNSLDFSDASLMECSDWAVTSGARVISNSWGASCGYNEPGPLDALSRYYDYLVRNYRVTVVFSAGNCGDTGIPYVGDPGRAYNVLTVGSYYHGLSGWYWGDDRMSAFSSWKDNPTTSQKPEVVAPGEDMYSTLPYAPWVGSVGSGTSYSAPIVAGEVALIMNRSQTYSTSPRLGVWPEAVKAIIMATADHNIEGESRYSGYDGAGGVNALAAFLVTNSRSTSWGGTTITYNSGSPVYFPSTSGVNFANSGKLTRAVIVWDSRSGGYGLDDTLNADLDLWLQRKSGSTWIDEARCGSSMSTKNNFEIVECNDPAPGYYRLKVSKASWADTDYSEYIGWALYQKDA